MPMPQMTMTLRLRWLGYMVKSTKRMQRSESYRVTYSLEEGTILASTKTYKQLTRRSRPSTSNYDKLRDRSMRKQHVQGSTRLGAGVVHLARLLALV